jgi:hypothetical protein
LKFIKDGVAAAQKVQKFQRRLSVMVQKNFLQKPTTPPLSAIDEGAGEPDD